MLGRFKVKFFFFFFLELLEFSEDRNRWESVEEKLNAIRYELLTFVVCFSVSFVPSFFPASRRPYLSLRPHLPLSSVSVRPSLPLRLPPPSLVHCLPIFVSSLPSPFYPYLPVLRSLGPSLHALFVLFCSFILVVCLPPPLATSHPHPSNACTNYISLVRSVSHLCDFDFLFALTIVLILLLFSETWWERW